MWVEGSSLDYFLLSIPYPFGPDLENLTVDGLQAKFLWVLPITQSEKIFRHTHSLEELEERFDDREIKYWDPARPPVV
jgi:hypothetical protein